MLDAESHVVGWSTVPNGEATTVTFAKDEIVTMVYPVIERGFWVKFDTDGGSYVQSVFCEPGKILTLSQVPTRNGYTFDGWYIGEEKVESVFASATVTAHWTASIPLSIGRKMQMMMSIRWMTQRRKTVQQVPRQTQQLKAILALRQTPSPRKPSSVMVPQS